MLDTPANKTVQNAAEKAVVQLADARSAIGQVVLGQNDVVDLTLNAILCGGHALLVGAPGLAKTLLVETVGTVTGLSNKRVQFTPDLMPADIIGSEVLETDAKGKREFRFIQGPVFTQLLMADEINRASPRTQSALLQAMQERFVTVAGQHYDLPAPFHVLATQNPIEQEGTYPLPEAQLDRFQMKISVGYPARADELQMLQTHEVDGMVARLRPVASLQDITTMIRMVTAVQIAPELRNYLIDLADASRRHQAVALGLSPRGTLSLQRVARARAASQGRIYVTDDDIKAVANSVMAHRVLIKPEAGLQGITSIDIVQDVLRAVPIPYDRK